MRNTIRINRRVLALFLVPSLALPAIDGGFIDDT